MKRRMLITTLLFLSIMPLNSFNNGLTITEKVSAAVPPEIQPCGNWTGYKYRTINGKLYKRLWSYTYSRWEEPTWTPV